MVDVATVEAVKRHINLRIAMGSRPGMSYHPEAIRALERILEDLAPDGLFWHHVRRREGSE